MRICHMCMCVYPNYTYQYKHTTSLENLEVQALPKSRDMQCTVPWLDEIQGNCTKVSRLCIRLHQILHPLPFKGPKAWLHSTPPWHGAVGDKFTGLPKFIECKIPMRWNRKNLGFQRTFWIPRSSVSDTIAFNWRRTCSTWGPHCPVLSADVKDLDAGQYKARKLQKSKRLQ